MIGDVLVLLRDRIDAFLRAAQPDEARTDALIQLPDGSKTDPVEFRLNALTLMLVHLEQETSLRTVDPYLRLPGESTLRRTALPVQLNLVVLLAARFTVYEQGLNQLGRALRFVQLNRAMEAADHPGMPACIERLVLELMTPSQAEHNEVWSALRVGYVPSLLLKVRMVVLRDGVGTAVPAVQSARSRVFDTTAR